VLETGKRSLNFNQACVVDGAGIFWEREENPKAKRRTELFEKIRNGESRFEEKHGRRQ